ncbi:unnamed protein product [Closterium sp. NIES-53]
MALRPSSVPLRVPLPSPPVSFLADGSNPESDLVRAASPIVTRLLATIVTDPSLESATAFALVAELVDIAAACHLDYAASLSLSLSLTVPRPLGRRLRVPTPLSGRQPWTQRWHSGSPQASTVKRPPGSPPVFKARYVARGFTQRQGVDFFQTFSPTTKMTTLWVLLHIAAQRDYELHSLDFSTAFLEGSLHEEIWLRRPAGFTGSFPASTQWSLRRPIYGLRQAPREWRDTLRMTVAALGFAPFSEC